MQKARGARIFGNRTQMRLVGLRKFLLIIQRHSQEAQRFGFVRMSRQFGPEFLLCRRRIAALQRCHRVLKIRPWGRRVTNGNAQQRQRKKHDKEGPATHAIYDIDYWFPPPPLAIITEGLR